MSARRWRTRLANQEAHAAIYIDFEGRKDKPPVLLGYYEEGDGRQAPDAVRHLLVDPLFKPLAEATGVPFGSLDTAFVALTVAAETSDRLIVAWSTHELTVARQSLGAHSELYQRFESRYVNALTLGRKWHKRLHPDWSFPKVDNGGTYRLARFLQLTGYRVPSMAGSGNTGRRLADIGELLSNGKPYERWTGTQKSKWTNTVRHNTHDILGMRHVCILAAVELEGITPG